jgi:hypothetical protein
MDGNGQAPTTAIPIFQSPSSRESIMCAPTLQTSLVYDKRTELAHFRAEAGKVYYYRTRLVMSRAVELLELDPIDSDQGRYLVASLPAERFAVPRSK